MKQDDSAVSNVLGAILMFGLLVVTLVTIQVQFVPVWNRQAESDYGLQATAQLGRIKSDFDQLAANRTNVPVVLPVTLARPEGFQFLQAGATLPGSARFLAAAAGEGMQVSSTRLTVTNRNGVALYGLSEQWTSVGAGQTLTNVANIAHLRLRIVDPANLQGSMTLTMTDTNGLCAGKIVLIDSIQSGSDNNVEAQVYGPRSPPAASCAATPISIEDWNEKKQLSPAYFYWNAFDANSQFPAVLAAANYPVSLQLSLSGLQGDYTIVYDTAGPGGTVRVGGAGIIVPNYSALIPAGRLLLDLPNQRLPSQTYSFEYGALFLDQPDGAAISIPTSFKVSTSATRTQLGWSFPALVGSNVQVTGARAATVEASPGGLRTVFDAVAPDVTFQVTTPHPAQWRAFWDTRMQVAGLSPNPVAPAAGCLVTGNAAQYSIATTTTSATLTVRGPCPNASDSTDDLSLTFQAATLAIRVQSAG